MKKLILIFLLAGTAPVHARVTKVLPHPSIDELVLLKRLRDILHNQQPIREGLQSVSSLLESQDKELKLSQMLIDAIDKTIATQKDITKKNLHMIQVGLNSIGNTLQLTQTILGDMFPLLRSQLQEHQLFLDQIEQEFITGEVRPLYNQAHQNNQQLLLQITQQLQATQQGQQRLQNKQQRLRDGQQRVQEYLR